MANNSQDTSNSNSQYNNNITMPIQPQQGQPREKIQQLSSELEKRQKRAAQNAHKRKSASMESERDKQKAEYEKSGNELKSLLAQFGTKAKVADEIDHDTKKLRNSIEALMAKAQAAQQAQAQTKVNKPIQVTPPPQPQSPQPQLTAIEQQKSFIVSEILDNLLYIFLFPFNIVINLIRLLYSSINWTIFLSCILFIELILMSLIWTVKRGQHTYIYVEPYEAVVHGTYGVDQTTSWRIVWSITSSISDFIAEVMNGGRGFGSPNYDGFVPI